MGRQRVSITILDLVDEVLNYLFSFLDEDERIKLSEVCRRFYNIVSDDCYWYRKLLYDVGVWNVSKVNGREHFEDYTIERRDESNVKAAIWNPGRSNKSIFAMCSPMANSKRRHLNFMKYSGMTIFSKFSLLLPKSNISAISKCLMFGPGLETPGISCILRKIANSHNSLFEGIRMKNGNTVTIKYEGELLDIIFLCANVKPLYRSLPANQRLNYNKLFTKNGDNTWQLNEPVKIACRISKAFVYVIDANAEIENIDDPFPDLTLILNYKHQKNQNRSPKTDKNIPHNYLCLLVLACIKDESCTRPNLQQLIHCLNLWKYNIVWQICLVTASTLSNISFGFDWMMAHLR